MFVKPIDRDIKGVIKVGQGEDSNVKQELEEYVVTRELQKHFAEFFSAYKKGITGNTDKMGVWISGFFGSGKSHFLKILSYLLENKVVDGKHAIDYFIDDKKITDGMVLGDMKLAAETPADVILFNVDSKGAASGKQDKDAIVSVFLKVFNEMQGFYGANPHIADLERKLFYDGRYNEFKEKFEETNGDPWVEARNEFDYSQDDVVDVLVDMGIMSEEAARNWCEKAFTPYNISIEEFAKLVKKYIDRKGKNHHIVFLVEESVVDGRGLRLAVNGIVYAFLQQVEKNSIDRFGILFLCHVSRVDRSNSVIELFLVAGTGLEGLDRDFDVIFALAGLGRVADRIFGLGKCIEHDLFKSGPVLIVEINSHGIDRLVDRLLTEIAFLAFLDVHDIDGVIVFTLAHHVEYGLDICFCIFLCGGAAASCQNRDGEHNRSDHDNDRL